MGACDFSQFSRARGRDYKKAFNEAVEEAQYEYGHGGYTGTIAEKGSVRLYGKAATLAEAEKIVDDLFERQDKVVCDKWGPALCIKVDNPEGYLFFGMASS